MAAQAPSAQSFGAFGSMPRLSAAMVLITCTAVTTLYATTITIANVSLPQIQGAMSATPDQIAWVITANLIATAVTIPAAGWLSARFGRRQSMLYGVAGFAISTVMCGTSNSLNELIFWRVIQSACGSPLTPIAQSIVVDQFPGRKRGPAVAVFGLGVTLGPTLAPLLGGYVSAQWSWRWVFFILVPIAVLAFVGVALFVRERAVDRSGARLDWTGFLSLAVTVGCIQFVLDRGSLEDWFESDVIILAAFVAALAGWVFVAHTLTSPRPLLDPRLLREWNFMVGIAISFIFGMVFVTPMVTLPPALQQVRGYPDIEIGMVLAIRGIGTVAAQFLMLAVSSRWDPRVLLLIGFGAQTLAGLVLVTLDVNITFGAVAVISIIQGFGVGCLWVPIILVVFCDLPQERTPDGMAMFHFVRSISSSYFISMSFIVAYHWARVSYSDMTAFASRFDERWTMPWVSGAWSLDSAAGLAQLSSEMARQSVMIGYLNSFWMYTWASLAVFPLILLVRWPPRGPGR